MSCGEFLIEKLIVVFRKNTGKTVLWFLGSNWYKSSFVTCISKRAVFVRTVAPVGNGKEPQGE